MYVAALLLTLALGQAEASPPAKDELSGKVKALVKQLDAVQQARRDAAEKELLELGATALEFLPPVTAGTPANVKGSLTRVRQALANQSIEASTKATLVTLEGEMKLSEALAAITKQTGNRFEDYREKFNQLRLDPSVKLTLTKKPFWEALDTVLDESEVTLYNYDEEADALAFISRGGGSPRKERASYGGPFRFDPVRVEMSRDLKTKTNGVLRIALDISWEPRIRPIVLQQPFADIVAVDDQGRTIEVAGAEGEVEVPVETANAGVELDIPLQAPERTTKSIKSLKGKISATILGRLEAFEYGGLDKLANDSQNRGGVTVTFERAKKNGEVYDVELRVQFDKAANALESHRGWIYNNPSFLLDEKGNRIENAGLEATLVQNNEVRLSYKFDLEKTLLKDCKFVYKTPAAIFKVPVEFEVKNIDLP